MNQFTIIALTPPGLSDPSIAIAACRAGAVGVLDLEHTREEQTARSMLKELARFTAGEFGVKRDGAGFRSLLRNVSLCPEGLRWFILADPDARAWSKEVKELRSRGIRVLLECTSLDEARIAEQIGIDGVIAKGNEAGGRVSEENTFVLLQRFLNHLFVPVWAQGGIGLNTAAACRAAGAAGVVLDSQLLFTRESLLSEPIRKRIANMDGSESLCLGSEIGLCYRLCSRLGLPVVSELQEKERLLARNGSSPSETRKKWRQEIEGRVGCDRPDEDLFLFGQDVALALSLAERFATVGGIVQALQQTTLSQCQRASVFSPLAEGSPLAASHGTKYPIVQGPMARISDVPDFALHVSREGGLPFVAVGWATNHELEDLLRTMRELFLERPWGVGLLGFLPRDVYRQQLETVLRYRPPFALIAGGRPDQVKALEDGGVAAYVHIPSPGLLKLSIQAGVRRFVFEGREAGGHVGPRSSFVLWEQMIDVLLETLPAQGSGEAYHVLFAGGIHDALSASMVAAMAVPLLERGVRVGLQMGTAYLFTEEAVSTGAIVEDYQQAAIRCDRTVLLEPGPGHTYRCVATPFATAFREEKRKLLSEGTSIGEIQETLERMSIGKLRIASKGVEQDPPVAAPGEATKLVQVDRETRQAQGMYLIGELASLRDRPLSVKALHQEVCVEGSKRLESLKPDQDSQASPPERKQVPSDIAIVGMACILPQAPDLRIYWENLLSKVNAIREIPRERWDPSQYFASDRKARDKVYSKWGAFLDEIPFDPLKYGMPPSSLSSIEPLQLLTLEVASRALEHAGYARRPFPRERTSVILGISGSGELGQAYAFRSSLPRFFGYSAEEIASHFGGSLPEWTEDSFPGILMNVAAGRIANRFDLGGTNFTVDGACASSLAAVYLAVKELESGSSDMVIVGGADTMQNPFTYFCFSKTQAFSPSGVSRPLDQRADGIVIGEGIALAIFKRLADAERDGDRIYAVIKGIGTGSDGRDKSMTAPRQEGQVRVLERAYEKAGFSPSTVGLVEAHATGTPVGDRVEIDALCRLMKAHGTEPKSCGIGSVKSMIGHTKSTAGMASLIKVALSLHHRVMPPTLGVETPAAPIQSTDCPLYVNTEVRPWFHDSASHPRRGSVSAFGFGGTNFHVVLEEYTGNFLDRPRSYAPSTSRRRSSELFLWEADSRAELLASIQSVQEALVQDARPELDALAFSVNRMFRGSTEKAGNRPVRLALVAGSTEDLLSKLEQIRQALASPGGGLREGKGVYFTERPMQGEGKLAFLFPGQGSQYPHMLTDLAAAHPAVQALFERSDGLLRKRLNRRLSEFISPPPSFTEEERIAQQKALAQTFIAQPALGTVSLALFHLLRELNLRPDMVAGHSYGEYVALCAAGALNERDLVLVSEARGRFMACGNGGSDLGTMAAVAAGIERVSETLSDMEGIWIANRNAPEQTVLSGTRPAIETAGKRFAEQGIAYRRIPVSCGFHSPLVSQACRQLKEFLSNVEFRPPRCAVYSNTTGKPYSAHPDQIVERLASHLRSRVEFIREIETMYEDGARIFVEVGPGRVLTGLVGKILGDRPHLAVCSNQQGRCGFEQLNHMVGQLAVHGVPVRIERLYEGRGVPRIDHRGWKSRPDHAELPSTTWLVSGTRARPLREIGSPEGERPIPPMPLASSLKRRTGPRVEQEKKETGFPPASWPDPGHRRTALKSDSSGAVHAFRRTLGRVDGSVDATIARFQQLMDRFLETQREVMLAYLRAPADRASRSAQPELSSSLPGDASGPVLTAQQGESRSSEPALAALAGKRKPSKDLAQGPFHGNAPTGTGGASRSDLQAQLLQLVGERTGYPEEMLGLDLDLEADLGIDSIKRIEILGTFMRTAPFSHPTEFESEMEGLTALRTLRDILRWIEERLDSEKEPEAQSAIAGPDPPAPAAEGVAETGREDGVPRFISVPRPVSGTAESETLPFHGVLLVTDDGGGVARELLGLLDRRGQSVALVQPAAGLEEAGEGSYRAILDTPQGVSELLDLVRSRQGPLAGLIHLLPLDVRASEDEGGLGRWRDLHRSQVKALFYLIRELAADPGRLADGGVRCVLAATRMGGSFAGDPMHTTNDFFPGNGGIAGLLKCLAVEWPGVSIKAVDLDPGDGVADLARHVFAEVLLQDRHVEVGRAGGRRLILEPVNAPLEPREAPEIDLDGSSVILITGGARGITAETAMELARRYRPCLILLGRSPMPPPEESPDTAGLTTPKEIKEALMNRIRQRGEPVQVSRVEESYQRLLAEREIRNNLRAIEGTGSRVRYLQADVRDPETMGKVLEEIYASHGRIDGVIHGAGIIEDKLMAEKTADSFDRVYDTKVDSAFLLSRNLRPESLKFLVFFSSVAGRFGNRGQGDYAAANEVLNKLAVQLDRKWAGRVVSINWGPWDSAGMISPELKRQFSQRGIQLIPRDEGPARLCEELLFGRKGEPEILLGSFDGWQALATRQREAKAFPLVGNGNRPVPLDSKKVERTRLLDPARDLFLGDHRLNGRPVLPAAFAMELMAEVVMQNWPDMELVRLEDVAVLRGLVLKNGPEEIRVEAEEVPPGSADPSRRTVRARITGALENGRPYYQATIELRKGLSDPPPFDPTPSSTLRPFPTSIEDAYRRWLFHGPTLQCISTIEGINEEGIIATVVPSFPGQCLSDSPEGHWVIDPVVLDSGFQLAILWARIQHDFTPLPSRFPAYHRYGSLAGREIRCHLRTLADPASRVMKTDLFFIDASGSVLGMFEQAESTCSRALNASAGVSLDEGPKVSG